MKKKLLFFILCFVNINVHSQIRCATVDPTVQNDIGHLNRIALFFQEFQCSGYFNKISSSKLQGIGCITIPVVVHIIHNGGIENISDAQIQSQIDVLNEDFLKMSGTNGDGNGVNTDIGFQLATIDPSGNPTNGIERIQDALTIHNSGTQETALKGLSQWNPNLYLNIWVVKELFNAQGPVLGYSVFPWNLNTAPNLDGVVIQYNYFGKIGSVSAPFDLGRTATHEIGHWLGLFHTFHDGCDNGDCSQVGDRCCDTPPMDIATGQTINGGCKTSRTTCNAITTELQNYMDYPFDVCMNMFTADQEEIMAFTLVTLRPNVRATGSNALAALLSMANPQCTSKGFEINAVNINYYSLKMFIIGTGQLVVNTGVVNFPNMQSGIFSLNALTNLATAQYNFELTLGGICNEITATGNIQFYDICKLAQPLSNDPSLLVSFDCKCRPFVIPSLDNANFNFGFKPIQSLGSNLSLINNGNLFVNANMLTGFGLFASPSIGSTSNLEICDATLTIENSTSFILGDNTTGNKANVILKNGSTLIIRNGGKLKINDNSKLIIESGATIIYEPGAEIQLLGDNAVLDIAGTLDIKDNATFTFTHPGANGGYIRMSNTITWPSKNIIAGTNCKMEFTGSGKLDKVLEIAQESLYDPQNHNFVHVHIVNGLVDFTYNDARIAMDSKKYFANSTFIANGGAQGISRGIEFYGNGTDYIQNCDFKDLNNGISGSLFYGGHPLSVSLCNFSNCTQPIKIVGEALYARDINMNFCTKGIQLEATTKASYIHNVFFESSGQNGYGFKINNSTGAPVYIDNSTVNNGLICAGGSVGIDGVQLEGGDLNIKCSVFSNMDNGISVGNGGFIDLSTLSENGYVNLTNNYFALKFDKAEGFQFQNGFNNFAFMDDACQVSTQVNIIGSILKPLAGPAINTNCDNNGWYAPDGSQLFAPPINLINYDLELCSQSQGQCTPLLLTDASPSPYSGCSHDDPCPSPPCDIAARVSLNNVRNITTAYFNNIPLDEAINDAFGATDTTLASVMNAMNLLSEIIDVNMANPTIDEQFADGFAYRGMQQTLSLMTSLKQKFGLTTNLQTYFSNLLTKIDSKINDAVALGDSDRFTFYTLDKAQVYMLKNDFDAALLVLNNLKNNSIVTNIEYINYWHCIASLQNQVLLGTLDKTEFFASLIACVPPQYARYQGIANNAAPSNSNFDMNLNVTSNEGTINLTYKSSISENVTITLYDALGNTLINKTEKVQTGINKFEYKNLNLNQAIYFMQCTTATAKQSRKFLVH